MSDLIDRQAAIKALAIEYVKQLPSAQPDLQQTCDLLHQQTDCLSEDDIETIRIHLSAFCENLCNQGRWNEAKEYERLIERFLLACAQPEIIRCNACKHWNQTSGKMKGFGLGECDFHDAKFVTCNGYCYWAERREDG